MPGVQLDDRGCRQMSLCAEMMSPQPTAIQSSPQRRARQSAGILAFHFGLPVELVSALDEIDMGEWTACPFAELELDPRWERWNTQRGSFAPPKGESMQGLQRRVVQHLEQFRSHSSDGTVVIVSHAEPIRAALLHYRGMALDDFLSIQVDPASVSTLSVSSSGIRVSRINQQVAA
jgi:probable phosphoglycerate mutase